MRYAALTVMFCLLFATAALATDPTATRTPTNTPTLGPNDCCEFELDGFHCLAPVDGECWPGADEHRNASCGVSGHCETFTPTPLPASTPTPTRTISTADCCQCNLLGTVFCQQPVPTTTPETRVCDHTYCTLVRASSCRGDGTCGAPDDTPTPTGTLPPSRTPTPKFVPTPGNCLGPALCTLHGTFTDNLRLCEPAAGDASWAPALNDNFALLDTLFPNCALQPSHGGTGLAVPPDMGDLLIGNIDGQYSLLPPGNAGQILTVDLTAALHLKWAFPASVSASGCPAVSLCDQDSERGKLAIDVSGHKLCVCNGAVRRWDTVDLDD